MKNLPYFIGLFLFLTMMCPVFGQQQAQKQLRGTRPQVILATGQVGGQIGSGDFRIAGSVLVDMGDIPIECEVKSFTLGYIRKRQDGVILENNSSRFVGAAASAVRAAKPGDRYSIYNVCAECGSKGRIIKLKGITFEIR